MKKKRHGATNDFGEFPSWADQYTTNTPGIDPPEGVLTLSILHKALETIKGYRPNLGEYNPPDPEPTLTSYNDYETMQTIITLHTKYFGDFIIKAPYSSYPYSTK